jgi:hypothetical protein
MGAKQLPQSFKETHGSNLRFFNGKKKDLFGTF